MSDIPYVPVPPTLIPNLTSKPEEEDKRDNRYYNDIRIPLGRFKEFCSVSVGSVLQTGANCGLAALSMVSTSTPKFLSISDLYIKAKCLGFTKNGEMFSAKNMTELAQIMLNPYYKAELISGGMDIHQHLITDTLHRGDLLLVPYDADKNNEPCCRKGHAAHWAVVCGILKHHDESLYVIGRQGKSKYPSIWSMFTLGKSNSNLMEVDPKKHDGNEYVLPTGGIIEGLANQFIILTKRSNELIST